MPILFGVVLLDLIGFGIVIPILPFLSPELGADKFDIAMIISVYALGSGLCGPYWGKLSDRYGRKPIIMICLAGAAVTYAMLAFAGELWQVYVARGLAGLMAGNLGVASAMMADITTPQNRARGMGLIGAAFGLGLILGPLLGGLLSSPDSGFMIPCLAAGVMSLLAIVAAAIFLPESLPAGRRSSTTNADTETIVAMLRRNKSRVLALQYVLHATCVSSVTYVVPLWFADRLAWGPTEVGILFGVQGGIMVALQGGALGAMVRLWGEIRLLQVSVTCFFVGMLCASMVDQRWAMIAVVYIAMSGATLCMPLLNSIVSHRTTESDRGRMMGTTAAASSWGRVVGPLFAGAVLSLAGYSAAWLGCAAIASFYLFWALRQPRHVVTAASSD